MIPEIILLALVSTVRPTSLAAVYALVTQGSVRFLWAYVVAGLAFAVAFGVLVVGVFHGIHVQAGTSGTRAVANIIGGVVILVFAVAFASGRVKRRRPVDRIEGRTDWGSRFSQRLTMRTAAIAGPLTHIPGIFYLVALNVIVAANPFLFGGLIAVLIYDVIWFAVPILALGLSIVRPAAASQMIVAVQTWTKEHGRLIVLVASFVAGTAMVIRGLVGVLT